VLQKNTILENRATKKARNYHTKENKAQVICQDVNLRSQVKARGTILGKPAKQLRFFYKKHKV
jgi:hypothetical protein